MSLTIREFFLSLADEMQTGRGVNGALSSAR